MNYILMGSDIGLTIWVLVGIALISMLLTLWVCVAFKKYLEMNEETERFCWHLATLLCLAGITLLPFVGLYFWKEGMINEYHQQINMSPREEIPFAGEIVPAIGGTGWNAYDTYTIHLHNVDNKMMRIVEPPDFGAALPIAGKQHEFQLSGDNYMIPFYHANPCVPTDIFVYNKTHYEHTVIKQACLCM